MDWSVSQIRTFAPDASALAAGEKISRSNWESSGQSGRALWGEIAGSGSRPYQVRVDLREFAFRCTCPSHKLPCKHVLGLLLRAGYDENSVPKEPEPDWIVEWLEQRDERAEKKKTKESTSAAPTPSSETKIDQQQKRSNQRLDRVTNGLEQYRLWLTDLIRSGLAGLETQTTSIWQEESRRLVDAQIPTLSTLVLTMQNIPGTGSDWPERLLGIMGRSALLYEAFQNRNELSSEFRQEVEQQLGWTVTQKELEATAVRVKDRWLLLGQSTQAGSNIETQFNWYWGCETKRFLLYLQFAIGRRGYSELLQPGSQINATAVFWPGTEQLRGRFIAKDEGNNSGSSQSPGRATCPEKAGQSIIDFLNDVSDSTARQPWRSLYPAFLRNAVVRLNVEKDRWELIDGSGFVLPLAGKDYWQLCALSASGAITLFGEWNELKLRPLSVWRNGYFVTALTETQQGDQR